MILAVILLSLIFYLIYSMDPLQESFIEGISKGEHLQELMTSVNDKEGGRVYAAYFEFKCMGNY